MDAGSAGGPPAFSFRALTRLVAGAGSIEQLGRLAAELGGSRVLVVSDPGVIAVGHTQRGIDALEAAGCTTAVFSDFSENPTTTQVEAGAAAARGFTPDLIVGLGGGSSMDCAKGSTSSSAVAAACRTIVAGLRPAAPCCQRSAAQPPPEQEARPSRLR